MSMVIAMILELGLFVCALWLLSFFSTFLHEVGHSLGYMIATGDRHWHIRVGSGKKLLNTKRLTVKLLPFDGCFMPSEENRIDTTAKRIAFLSGGPAVSLLLVAVLLPVNLGGISVHSEVIASGAIEFFFRSALFINLFILVMALLPTPYFHGEVRGMESDGLQILNAIKSHRSK